MYTTKYTPGTKILIAGETFRYLGEFYADFINKKTHMYIPIETSMNYTSFVGEPEWHSRNNIPESAVPFWPKFEAEIILEEGKTCK